MKLTLRKPDIYQYLLIAILLLGFARGMMYANLMPPWGILDEEQHFDYIKRLAEDHTKPIVGETYLSQEILDNLFEVRRWETFHWPTPNSQTPEDMWIEVYSYQGYQPPLYYFLLAPFYAVVSGSVLFKLFFLRWVTVILSLFTVWIAIRWTKDLFPSQNLLPYFVGLILVLIPERTMATSRINNDALLEVFGAVFLWLSTRAITGGLTPSRARWVALTLALGVLTKVSMGALGIVLLVIIWVNRRRSDLVKSCLWMAGILSVLVLPFVAYNWIVYGDLTGIAGFKRLLASSGELPVQPFSIAGLFNALIDTFAHFWVVWWKSSGIGSNPVLKGIYLLLALLTVFSIVGVVFSLRARHRAGTSWSRLIVSVYLVLIGLYVLALLTSYFSGQDSPIIQEPEIQGRFLLPVVVPIVMLFSVGLYSFPCWRWPLFISAGLTLIIVDGLNLFGNLLRHFYYWAWFYDNGQPVAMSIPTLQQGMNLFFTRFWMDKPDAIRPVIYLAVPFYLLALIGVIVAFYKVGGFKIQLDWRPGTPCKPENSSSTQISRGSFNITNIFRDPLLWAGIILFALYMLIAALRPPEIFWSLDEGGKFIYMQNTIRYGNPSVPLDYPGRAIDLKAEFIPLYWQVRVSDTEIYSWWPVGFPLVTIPFYLLFGWVGIYILPAIAGAISASVSGLITRRLLPQGTKLDLLAALLVGVTTPVFYYSTMFWEHTLSTVFFLISVYCMVIAYQKQGSNISWWALSGVFFSISAFFRTDALPLALGFGIVILLTHFWRAVAYGVGFVATSAPWLIFNKLVMGDFLSRQMTSIESQGWFVGFRAVGLKFIPYALFNAPLVQALPIGMTLLILGMLCVIVAVVAPFFRRLHWAVLAAYTGLLAISAWALFNPWGYRSVHGFLLIAPQVIFCIWFWVTGDRKKFSFIHLAFLIGLIVYSIVYLTKMWVAGGGQQWGPRYQLAIYPLLIIASLVGIAYNWNNSHRYARVGILALFIAQAVVGAGFELRGVFWAQKAAEYYNASREEIYNLPDKPITTNCTFLPMIMPEFYQRGTIFNLAGKELKTWANAVASQGVTDFYNIDVDICSYNHLDAVVENRKQNPGGMIIQEYNVQDFIE